MALISVYEICGKTKQTNKNKTRYKIIQYVVIKAEKSLMYRSFPSDT